MNVDLFKGKCSAANSNKLIYCIHWSGAKLGRIFSDFDPTCVRCKVEPATLLHMFWGCHKLSGFWEFIFKCFSDIYDTDIDPSPLTDLFGVLPIGTPLSRIQSDTVAYTTLLARRLIIQSWKMAAPPSYKYWGRDVLCSLKLDIF